MAQSTSRLSSCKSSEISLSNYQLLKEVKVQALFHDELSSEFTTTIKLDNLDKIQKYNIKDIAKEVDPDSDISSDNDNITVTTIFKKCIPRYDMPHIEDQRYINWSSLRLYLQTI